jgi:hypothetical protein
MLNVQSMSTRNSVLMECDEDYVGLWSILRDIYRDNLNIDSLKARRKTLDLIKELMQDKLIQPGMFTGNANFELWKLSPQETITRIEAEWDALGREPNIGEIVWFITTEKGEKVVKEQMKNMK